MTTYTLTVTDARRAPRTVVHALTEADARRYLGSMEGLGSISAEALTVGAREDGRAVVEAASDRFVGAVILTADRAAARYAVRWSDQETATILDAAEADAWAEYRMGTREAFRSLREADRTGYGTAVVDGMTVYVEALGDAYGHAPFTAEADAEALAVLTVGTRVEAVEATGWGHDYTRGAVVTEAREATATAPAVVVVTHDLGDGTTEGTPATMAAVWHPVEADAVLDRIAEARAARVEASTGTRKASTAADGGSTAPQHRLDVDGVPLDRYAAARWAGHAGRRFTDGSGHVWMPRPDDMGRTVWTRPAADGGTYVLDGHGAGRMRWTVQHVPAGLTRAAVYADPAVWYGMTDSRAEGAAWAVDHDAVTEAPKLGASPAAVADLAEALAADTDDTDTAASLGTLADTVRRHGVTLAFHADGERCDRATTTADCPRSHDYRTAAALILDAAEALGMNDAAWALDADQAEHDGRTAVLAYADTLGMTAADVLDALTHAAGGISAEPEALAWGAEHGTAVLAHYRGAAATYAAEHGAADTRRAAERISAARDALDAVTGTAHRLGAVGTAVVWQGLDTVAASLGAVIGRADAAAHAHRPAPLSGEWADDWTPQSVTAETVRILAAGDDDRATEARHILSTADVDALAQAWEDAYAEATPSTDDDDDTDGPRA